MAAIGRIRKHSTILLIVVAGALLAFILGDFGRKGGNSKLQDKFIVVGKNTISYNDYMHQYNSYRDLVKEREGRNLSSEEDFQLGNQLFESLVDSILLADESDRLGISVTNEETRDLVAGPNAHQYAQRFFSDGTAYNMQLANQFLDNMDQYDTTIVKQYMELERYIVREATVNKYFNLLTHSFNMPKAMVKKMQEENALKADIELVQVPYNHELVSDDKISVSQSDIKKWYEDNKFRFKQDEEYREVEYVMFRIEPSVGDLQQIEEDVHRMYTEFATAERPQDYINHMVDSRYDSTYKRQGELIPALDTILFTAPAGTLVEPFVDGNMWTFAKLLNVNDRPDSVNINFIFVAERGVQGAPRTKAEADAKIDSAMQALQAGEDFAAVAKAFSDIPIEGQPDEGRIWLVDGLGDGQLFFDTLYKHAEGSLVKYEYQGGTYIFRINERTAFNRKVQVAIGKKEIAPSRETIDNIESRANSFVNGLSSISDFDKAVTAQNLDKRSFERVEKMSYTLPGVTVTSRDIVHWIYDKATKKGDVSQVFTTENAYVVVALKGIYPKGYMSLEQEQIKTYCETMAKRDKKSAKLEELLAKDVKAGSSLASIAGKYKSEAEQVTISYADRNFSHYGPEDKVIGKLMGQKVGSTQVYVGDMGVYVIKINKIDVPSLDVKANDENADMLIQQYSMMMQSRVQNQATPALKKMVKIKDNRTLVF